MPIIKLNLKDDIGTVALILALEDRIFKTITEYGTQSMTYKATMDIYNQIKKEFETDFNFKY